MKSSRSARSQKFIYRVYWNAEKTHCPYVCVLHTLKDKELTQMPLELRSLFADALDGDEIEIKVTVTGNRPVGDKKWKLLKPHTYGPES